MQLPRDDTRRQAWLSCDCFSTAFVTSYPSERDALSAAEFPEVISTYLGRESPLCRRVDRDYRRHAARLDAQFQTGGAVLALITTFGQTRGLVWGNYAEASDDVHQLRECAAAEAARQNWERMGCRTEAEARGYFAAQMRYRWGIAAARAFARHRVRRVCYVGAARRPRAAQIVGRPEGEWGMATAVAFQAAQGWRWGGQGGGRAGGGW